MEVATDYDGHYYMMQAPMYAPQMSYMPDAYYPVAQSWHREPARYLWAPCDNSTSQTQSSSEDTVLPLDLEAVRQSSQPRILPKSCGSRRIFRSKSCGAHEDSPHTAVVGSHSAVKFKRTFIQVVDSPAAHSPAYGTATPMRSFAGTPHSPYADYGTTLRHRDFDGTYFHNPFEDPYCALATPTATIAENEPWYLDTNYGRNPFTITDYVNATPSTSGVSISNTTASVKSSPEKRLGAASSRNELGVLRPQREDDEEEEPTHRMCVPPCEPLPQDDRGAKSGVSPVLVFKTAGQRRRYYRDLKMKRLREEAIAQGTAPPTTKKQERRKSMEAASNHKPLDWPSKQMLGDALRKPVQNGWDGIPPPPLGSSCRSSYDAHQSLKAGWDMPQKIDMNDGYNRQGSTWGRSAWRPNSSYPQMYTHSFDITCLSLEQIGALIGKNGCNSKDVRSLTGATMWVSPTGENVTGMRVLDISARDPIALNNAVTMVQQLLSNVCL